MATKKTPPQLPPLDAPVVPMRMESEGIVVWEPGMSDEEAVRRTRQAIEKRRAREAREKQAPADTDPKA